MKINSSLFAAVTLTLSLPCISQTVDNEFFSELVEIRDSRLGLVVSKSNEHILYVENAYAENGKCVPKQKGSPLQDDKFLEAIEDFKKREKAWNAEYAKVHPKIVAESQALQAKLLAERRQEMVRINSSNISLEEKRALLAKYRDPEGSSKMLLDAFNEVKNKHAGFLGPYPEAPKSDAKFSHVNAILLVKNRDSNELLLATSPPDFSREYSSFDSSGYSLADEEIEKFRSTYIADMEKTCPAIESIIFRVGFYDLVNVKQKLRSEYTDKLFRIVWEGDGTHKNIDRKWQYNLYDKASAFYYMSAQVSFSKKQGAWSAKAHGIQEESYSGTEYYIESYMTLAEVIKDWGDEPPFLDYSVYELSLMNQDGKSIQVPHHTNPPTSHEIRLAVLREHQLAGAQIDLLTGEVRIPFFDGVAISILDKIDAPNCQSSGNSHRCTFNSEARTYFGEGGVGEVIGDAMAAMGSRVNIVKRTSTHDFELTAAGWRSKSLKQNIGQRTKEMRQSVQEGVAEGLKAGSCAAAQLGPDILIPTDCR